MQHERSLPMKTPTAVVNLFGTIVFVVGAILLVLVTSAFQNPIKTWFETTVKAWFNKDTTGKYPTDANLNPTVSDFGA